MCFVSSQLTSYQRQYDAWAAEEDARERFDGDNLLLAFEVARDIEIAIAIHVSLLNPNATPADCDEIKAVIDAMSADQRLVVAQACIDHVPDAANEINAQLDALWNARTLEDGDY